MMTTLTLAATKLYFPAADDPINTKPTMPPGMGGISTLIGWVLWICGTALFVLFIIGIFKAARARNKHGEVDAEAPLWPLIAAIALGAAGTIWRVIVPA